jgi:hypothetical protein
MGTPPAYIQEVPDSNGSPEFGHPDIIFVIYLSPSR